MTTDRRRQHRAFRVPRYFGPILQDTPRLSAGAPNASIDSERDPWHGVLAYNVLNMVVTSARRGPNE
jgi:hypothetical protein